MLCAKAEQHVLHHVQIAAPVGSRSNRGTNGVTVNRGHSWDGERVYPSVQSQRHTFYTTCKQLHTNQPLGKQNLKHHLLHDIDEILQEEEEGVSGVWRPTHFNLQELLIVVHVDEPLQLPPAVLGPMVPLVQVHLLLLTLPQHVAPQKHLTGQQKSFQVSTFRETSEGLNRQTCFAGHTKSLTSETFREASDQAKWVTSETFREASDQAKWVTSETFREASDQAKWVTSKTFREASDQAKWVTSETFREASDQAKWVTIFVLHQILRPFLVCIYWLVFVAVFVLLAVCNI